VSEVRGGRDESNNEEVRRPEDIRFQEKGKPGNTKCKTSVSILRK